MRRLQPRFHKRLLSMYQGESQLGTGGLRHPIDDSTRISVAQGIYLYDICLSIRPKETLEIGLAFGFSTIFILAALADGGGGRHTAIDPHQRTTWQGIGLSHATELADSTHGLHFKCLAERSDRAIVDLIRKKRRFELIFIDGNHRFDDVLIDFTLSAQLCSIAGYIVLDDMCLPSVRLVASFIRKNRSDFVEMPSTSKNMGIFKKIAWDLRPWSHFIPFKS